MKDSHSIPFQLFLCRSFVPEIIQPVCSHSDTVHHLQLLSFSPLFVLSSQWCAVGGPHSITVLVRIVRRLSCKSSWCSTDHRCLSFCLNSSSATWDWLSVSCFDFSLPLSVGCARLMEANDAQKTDISYTCTYTIHTSFQRLSGCHGCHKIPAASCHCQNVFLCRPTFSKLIAAVIVVQIWFAVQLNFASDYSPLLTVGIICHLAADFYEIKADNTTWTVRPRCPTAEK